ncbi:hypothetical protein [Nocardioides sp. SYSU D00038]|uniref:hypothetical protein n=1 Tax=Nocardioides sp. SYSU D00038 TaxID=2812554 RepID=UPI001967E984|nr:hypothetical protein [Nocardioides sp. SYSU D00038]
MTNPASSETARQHNLRAGAAARLAESVAGGGTAGTAAHTAMLAVVAKEAGLIGSTFTTATYETVTQPIDAVLAMPTGY